MSGALHGKRVLVTRARDQASTLVDLLRDRGAIAIEAPMITVAPATDYTALDKALCMVGRYDWMIFTSANTVRFVGQRLASLCLSWQELGQVRLCAVGPKTATALIEHGLSIAYQPERLNSLTIGDSLPDVEGRQIFIACGDLADRALAQRLSQRGATVDEALAYRTLLDTTHEQEIRQLLERHEVDILTFASSSTVRNLVTLLGPAFPDILDGCVVACIGPVTAATARELGLQPQIVSDTATIEAMVEAMERTLSMSKENSTSLGNETISAELWSEKEAADTFATPLSDQAFSEAQCYIPGGVNSPVRAFKAVGRTPIFIDRAEGAYLFDLDGHRYIDYVGSYGPLIVGHAHPAIVEAINRAARRGTSFGAPTLLETRLAKMISHALPSMELVRFVSSGTEACMSTLRVARAFTGREIILKIDGGYHGHSDGLLARAGSGPLTLGTPDSPGVPASIAASTITIPFNDLDALQRALTTYEVAAFILEPLPANMGVVPPADGYLQGVRDLTTKHGTLLIFDEVISGFRLAYGGAQAHYSITPDLTCLGKIIGGGLPVGAYGGRHDIMSMIAPSGPVYQAGTLSGNPLAMSAGIAMLDLLGQAGVYPALDQKSTRLSEGLVAAATAAGVRVHATRVGSVQTLFFATQPIIDYASVKTSRTADYAVFFQKMLAQGIYLAPSQFEAAFVSTAHTDNDIEITIGAASRAFAAVAASATA